MNDTTNVFEVLKAPPGLARFLPMRIVLRKLDDGTYHGLCEDSFSMSTEPGIARIWWSGKAYSMIGEHTINGIDDANRNSKEGDIIVDPLSDDCPVQINWDRWLSATTKYGKRNASFSTKEVE